MSPATAHDAGPWRAARGRRTLSQGAAPYLPDALWYRIAWHLSLLDLIKAAPTNRLFLGVLKEKLQAGVNRCLAAAQSRWGSHLSTYSMAFSLSAFGLHPPTLHTLLQTHHPQPPPAVPIMLVDGIYKARLRGGMDFISGAEVVLLCQAPLCAKLNVSMVRRRGPSRAHLVRLSALEGELGDWLGLLLSVAQVRWEQDATCPAVLHPRLRSCWWLEARILAVYIEIPWAQAARRSSARSRLTHSARRRLWLRALHSEAASDALCVAVSLQMCCGIIVSLEGDSDMGHFFMHRRGCQCARRRPGERPSGRPTSNV